MNNIQVLIDKWKAEVAALDYETDKTISLTMRTIISSKCSQLRQCIADAELLLKDTGASTP